MNDKTTIETLIGPAKVNGKRCMPGDEVDVTARIKKQLQESGALPLPVDGPVENEDTTPEASEDRIADILAALEKGVVKTITEKAEDFNKTGRKALDKELGWPAGDEDINAALEQFTAKE